MTKNMIPAALFALLSLSVGCKQPGAVPGAAPTTSAASAGDSTVVAVIGGKNITLGELDKAAGRELYDVREQALENLIKTRVIDDTAQKAGMKSEDYLRKQVEAKVPQVSVDEAKAFFEANKQRLGPQFQDKQFDDVKDMIVQGLTGQKRQEAVASVIEELKKNAGVKILLHPPKVQVAAEGPAKGPATAKVTIVEFSDFQCPFCSRGRKTMDEVVAKYGDKVRLVFRDFPLDFHDKAQKAAEAGQCANDQGKFWEMHNWMFDNQNSLDVDALKGAAKTIGLDAAKFDQCLTSGQHAALIAKNMKEGQAAGVRGTPAFFVNGTFISGAQPFEKFKTEIDRALAE